MLNNWNMVKVLSTVFNVVGDEIQTQDFENMSLSFGDKRVLLEDTGNKEFDNFSDIQMPRLSASQIESYLDCPFKLTASKVFGLRMEPEVDLDMDRMRKGRLIHKCFEIVLERGLHIAWSDKLLADVINEARFVEGLQVSAQLWSYQIQTQIQLLKRFIEF